MNEQLRGGLPAMLGVMVIISAGVAACGEADSAPGEMPSANVGSKIQQQTIGESECDLDPRVWSGLVPFEVCVGARIFFDETFDGNGRTCGSCHPAGNNFTIDEPFMASLEDSDPLFVADNEEDAFDLAGLETAALRDRGNIKENVDGFEDNDDKFVMRAVPHLFSMSQTIERDETDGTSAEFVERTGWSGDGVQGGALRDFANGAIVQHFPKDLSREPGESFRLATDLELDRLLAFQLSLGRKNELDLEQVQINDPFAAEGRSQFLDPQVGRCNECHDNAGANDPATGKNANFETGIEIFAPSSLPRPTFAGVELFDGGFGGQGLDEPNFIVEGEVPNALGDGSFNTPSLIEAADTGPFFHHNGLGGPEPTGDLVAAVAFYASDAFNESQSGQDLAAEFGGPVTIDGMELVNIAQFLKVLNIAFNLDIARQRLEASELLNFQYWDYRKDIQHGLLDLARAEVEDTLGVMVTDGVPLHVDEQPIVEQAISTLQEARATSDAATRLALTRQALEEIAQVRNVLGTNIHYELGPGTLMF